MLSPFTSYALSRNQAGILNQIIIMDEHKLSYWVYILTNKSNNVFYVGVTSNINQRIVEHKMKLYDGFTSKYNVDKLIYFEHFTDVYYAIAREKRLKRWNREWKMRLISKTNSEMRDMIYDFMNESQINDMKSYILEREKIKAIPAKSMRG